MSWLDEIFNIRSLCCAPREEPASITSPALGILRLDDEHPALPEHYLHGTFLGYKVIYRRVPGLTFEICASGQMPPEVQECFIEAIQWLETKGAIAISGDCGLMLNFQDLARDSSSRLVFTSSLLQMPMVTMSLESYYKIAIFSTADGTHTDVLLEAIQDECVAGEASKDRFVIVSCKDFPGFSLAAKGEAIDEDSVEQFIVEKAESMKRDNPLVAAVFMECTFLSSYSDAVRDVINLPVYDFATCAKRYLASMKPNTSSGQEELPSEETSMLGIIALEYNDPALDKDMDSVTSLGYLVIRRTVPGLTLEVCTSGILPPLVKEQLRRTVRDLEDVGVDGITGDCGLMMTFQNQIRQWSAKPVFMSSLVQMPSIFKAIKSTEKVAILTGLSSSSDAIQRIVKAECGAKEQLEDRIVIVGCEDVYGFEPTFKADATYGVEGRIVNKATRALRSDRSIAAFLMESAGLPHYSNAVRTATGLPVFDMITCAKNYPSTADNYQGPDAEWPGTPRRLPSPPASPPASPRGGDKVASPLRLRLDSGLDADVPG